MTRGYVPVVIPLSHPTKQLIACLGDYVQRCLAVCGDDGFSSAFQLRAQLIVRIGHALFRRRVGL